MRYPKDIILKDGGEALIRPLDATDEAELTQFYRALPEADRWYMRFDALDPSVMIDWIEGPDKGHVFSIIAIVEGGITAHARLYMRGHGATKHIGKLRISVLPKFRHQRLGTWMLLDLIRLAMDKGLSDLRADFVVGVEDAAIDAAYKLDFFKRAILEDYVKGPTGQRHDLMIMTKRLHKNWSDF